MAAEQRNVCINKNFRNNTALTNECHVNKSTKQSLQNILTYQKNKLACSVESLNSLKQQQALSKEKKQVKLINIYKSSDQKGVRHSFDTEKVSSEKQRCERG